MPIETYTDVHRHDGKPIPAQPPKAGFPLYLYSYAPVNDPVKPVRPYRHYGAAAIGVGIFLGGLSMASQIQADYPMVQGGLLTVFAAAVVGGMAAIMERRPVAVSRQLLYFDGANLIIDNFDHHPSLIEVRKLRVGLVDIYHGDDKGAGDTGDFLCLYHNNKKDYIGTFLSPDELTTVKQLMDHAMGRLPRHLRLAQVGEQRRSSGPPSPDTLA